jgi:hypothetical protein
VSDLWFALPILEGRLIRLEPLELHHAAGYLSAAGTGSDAAEVFRWLNPPGGGLAEPVTIEDAERHILAALAARVVPRGTIRVEDSGHGHQRNR